MSYKSGRIPIIPLSYSSKHLAKKKELLFDYDKGKLYVVSAEDKSIIFDITSQIIAEINKEGVDVNNFVVTIEGIGKVNLSEFLSNLNSNMLQAFEEEPIKTYSPTVRFDNTSLILFDGQAAINGFTNAKDGTYPVKKDGYVQWVERTDYNVSERLRKLEENAPPDPEEWSKFKEDFKNIKINSDLYNELPVIKQDVTTNTNRITELTNLIDNLSKGSGSSSEDLNSLTAKVTSLNTRVGVIEARGDLTDVVQSNTSRIEELEKRPDTTTGISNLTDTINSVNQRLTDHINNQDVHATGLANRLATLEGKHDSLTSEVKNHGGRLDNIDSTIESLKNANLAKIDSLNNTVETLSNKYSTIEGTVDINTTLIRSLQDSVTQTNEKNNTKFNDINSKISGFDTRATNIEKDVFKLTNNNTSINAQLSNIDEILLDKTEYGPDGKTIVTTPGLTSQVKENTNKIKVLESANSGKDSKTDDFFTYHQKTKSVDTDKPASTFAPIYDANAIFRAPMDGSISGFLNRDKYDGFKNSTLSPFIINTIGVVDVNTIDEIFSNPVEDSDKNFNLYLPLDIKSLIDLEVNQRHQVVKYRFMLDIFYKSWAGSAENIQNINIFLCRKFAENDKKWMRLCKASIPFKNFASTSVPLSKYKYNTNITRTARQAFIEFTSVKGYLNNNVAETNNNRYVFKHWFFNNYNLANEETNYVVYEEN